MGKLFGCLDLGCHRTAQAVLGNHRAPSGDPGGRRRGRRGDGRTEGGAHRYPRHGKGVKEVYNVMISPAPGELLSLVAL